ncbi:MAG: hypothetical protein O6830_05270, partial [Candidatus Dadabacteria bacterium]|nr:hypothetical protein [Candidatus Dadabacteria bacterium]
LVVILAVIYFSYDLLKRVISPCDSIFEQTTLQLSTKVEVFKTSADIVLGSKKIQEISESAQETALTLKACCKVSRGDSREDKFIECKNTTSKYEDKIDLLIAQVAEAKKAKTEGNTETYNQNLTKINQSIDDVKSIARKFQSEVNTLTKTAKEEQKIYFFDDFDGDELKKVWKVINPDPDSFIVEEGMLMAFSSLEGNLSAENISNVFRLGKPMPEGDWVATVKLDIDFQSERERVFFGLYDDKDNYLVNVLSTARGSCYSGGSYRFHLYMTPTKVLKNIVTENSIEVWNIERCNKGSFNELMANGQPILIRLEKRGRAYTSAIKLEGTEEPAWIELPEMKLLRANGNLTIGLYQASKGKGETTVKVDWVKIEKY